jgi:uncharacterized protein
MNQTKASIAGIPYMGAGLGHRREVSEGIRTAGDQIDFVEIITEKYISAPRWSLDLLAQLAEQFVVIPHGVSLSVGTAAPTSKSFLQSVRQICTMVNAPYYSDHLAVTQSPGIDIGHLSPVTYNPVTLAHVIDNIKRVQDFLGLPFVLENITETHVVPGSTMALADFLHQVVDRTDCGILLDVTNLYTNSVNLGFDPLEFSRRYPLDSVVQVHLAGGVWSHGQLVDSHSESVPAMVWDLFGQLVPEMPHLKGALIERDDNYPPFEELLGEIRTARHYMNNCASRMTLAA